MSERPKISKERWEELIAYLVLGNDPEDLADLYLKALSPEELEEFDNEVREMEQGE